MVKSRQLFLRSRLELAAELAQNAPGDIFEYFNLRDFGFIDALSNAEARGLSVSWRQKVYFLSLALINFPFAFVYGPTFLFVWLTSGQAAAARYMPSFLLKAAVPSENDDDDDDWKGRVLDVEKRTKALLKPVVAKMDEMQTKMDKMDEMQTKMDELHAKVDRMQAENKQIRAESEARMQQMQAESEARMQQMQAENKQMQAESEARMQQMQAENEARAKITEEKLDLIVSLMSPRT